MSITSVCRIEKAIASIACGAILELADQEVLTVVWKTTRCRKGATGQYRIIPPFYGIYCRTFPTTVSKAEDTIKGIP